MFGLAYPPFDWRLHVGEVHLARHLQCAGYFTAQIGTQHVTGHDDASMCALGFDHVARADVAEQATAFLRSAPLQPFFLNIGFVEPHRAAQGLFKPAPPDASRSV